MIIMMKVDWIFFYCIKTTYSRLLKMMMMVGIDFIIIIVNRKYMQMGYIFDKMQSPPYMMMMIMGTYNLYLLFSIEKKKNKKKISGENLLSFDSWKKSLHHHHSFHIIITIHDRHHHYNYYLITSSSSSLRTQGNGFLLFFFQEKKQQKCHQGHEYQWIFNQKQNKKKLKLLLPIDLLVQANRTIDDQIKTDFFVRFVYFVLFCLFIKVCLYSQECLSIMCEKCFLFLLIE